MRGTLLRQAEKTLIGWAAPCARASVRVLAPGFGFGFGFGYGSGASAGARSVLRSTGAGVALVLRRHVKADSFVADELSKKGEKLEAVEERPDERIPPPDPDAFQKTTPKVERLLEEILNLNVIEINQLMNAFQKRLGLTDEQLGMGMGMMGGGVAPAAAAAAAPAPEEQKPPEKEIFDVKLTGFDEKNKIKVIKEVRTITGLGLKEAKEAVENLPRVLKKDVKKEDAEKIKLKLVEVGAKVEVE